MYDSHVAGGISHGFSRDSIDYIDHRLQFCSSQYYWKILTVAIAYVTKQIMPVMCQWVSADMFMSLRIPVRRQVDACLQPIWPPTVSWSPTKVVVSCVLPHQGRALSDGPTATMETAVLQRQVRNCETAFKLICDKLTLTFSDVNG